MGTPHPSLIFPQTESAHAPCRFGSARLLSGTNTLGKALLLNTTTTCAISPGNSHCMQELLCVSQRFYRSGRAHLSPFRWPFRPVDTTAHRFGSRYVRRMRTYIHWWVLHRDPNYSERHRERNVIMTSLQYTQSMVALALNPVFGSCTCPHYWGSLQACLNAEAT